MPYDETKEEEEANVEAQEKIIEERLNNFLELGQPIHISLKSGNFLNGILIKKVGNFFLLNERVLGLRHILPAEVFSVDLYMPKEKTDKPVEDSALDRAYDKNGGNGNSFYQP